jgi:hypothetical protein
MDNTIIASIARELKPAYQPVLDAWDAINCKRGEGVAQMQALEDACAAYNEQFLRRLPVLASVTPNSATTLRQAFAPKDEYSTYPTPEFLMNVANYNSFNDKLWTKASGMYREPSNNFTF